MRAQQKGTATTSELKFNLSARHTHTHSNNSIYTYAYVIALHLPPKHFCNADILMKKINVIALASKIFLVFDASVMLTSHTPHLLDEIRAHCFCYFTQVSNNLDRATEQSKHITVKFCITISGDKCRK